MRIINAVYQLSEIQRTRGEARSASNRSPRAVPVRPAEPVPPADTPPSQTGASQEQILSLSEMLYQHFADEVRQRDRDADGRLSLAEFGGTREEFEALDRTGKGYVNARDLTREALARNPELRNIIHGPWTPIYESLIQVKEPDDESLIRAVREGAARVAEQTALQDGRANGMAPPAPSADQISAITTDFIMSHRELLELHNRLQTLADRLGRIRRYASVDCVG